MKRKEFTEKYGLVSIIGAIMLGAFTFGGIVAMVSGRWFTSAETRMETEKYMKIKPTNVDAYKAFEKWEKASEDAIRSRANRDSIMLSDRNENKKRDSIMLDKIERMSITQYKTYKLSDSTNTNWNKYNASVEE